MNTGIEVRAVTELKNGCRGRVQAERAEETVLESRELGLWSGGSLCKHISEVATQKMNDRNIVIQPLNPVRQIYSKVPRDFSSLSICSQGNRMLKTKLQRNSDLKISTKERGELCIHYVCRFPW